MITRQRNNKIKNDNETTTITSGDNQIITHNEREKERGRNSGREKQKSRERSRIVERGRVERKRERENQREQEDNKTRRQAIFKLSNIYVCNNNECIRMMYRDLRLVYSGVD